MMSSMDGVQFNVALERARKGERITYHVGLLMSDRNYFVEVDNVARAVWQAHLDGKVHLLQRRVSPTSCQYYAQVKR